MIQASVSFHGCAPRGFNGESLATAGVDVQAAPGAPGRELIRIDYGANGDNSLAFRAALCLLCHLEPAVERAGQLVRIVHDFENATIILAAVPDEANSPHASCHNQAPFPGEAA